MIIPQMDVVPIRCESRKNLKMQMINFAASVASVNEMSIEPY